MIYRVQCVKIITEDKEPEFEVVEMEAETPERAHEKVEKERTDLTIIDIFDENNRRCHY